uniref:Uncharacterized protein n=1 Tax=Anguilla anguilla TaxID=7936 RepID=A0A0E9RDN2_ANGAN
MLVSFCCHYFKKRFKETYKMNS